MLENITTLTPTTSGELMSIPFEVVSKQECINYSASVVRNNYIMLAVVILMGVSWILWANRRLIINKIFPKYFPNLHARYTIAKMMSDKDLEDLGAEFTKGLFSGKKSEEEIKDIEEIKKEMKAKQVNLPIPGEEDGRRNNT